MEALYVTDGPLTAAETVPHTPRNQRRHHFIISNLTEEALFLAISVAARRVVPHDRSTIFLSPPDKKVLRLFAIESSVTSPRFVVGMGVDSQQSHAVGPPATSGYYGGAIWRSSVNSPLKMCFSRKAFAR